MGHARKIAAVYLQDDYKLTRNLTLTPGLRYEFESALTERYNRTATGFDFSASSPVEAAARAAYAASPIPQLSVADFRVRGGLLFADSAGQPRQFWDAGRGHIMPRIGLVYSPTPATVIRTGYGIFFDTVGTKSSPIQSGFSQSTSIVPSLDNGLHFTASLADPLPTGLLPAAGAAGGLSTNLGQTVTFFPRQMIPAYAQRWSFGIQQQFLHEFVLDASYVGNRGTHLNVSREFDPIPRSVYSTLPYRDQTTRFPEPAGCQSFRRPVAR